VVAVSFICGDDVDKVVSEWNKRNSPRRMSLWDRILKSYYRNRWLGWG
jgi:hypothetical protein